MLRWLTDYQLAQSTRKALTNLLIFLCLSRDVLKTFAKAKVFYTKYKFVLELILGVNCILLFERRAEWWGGKVYQVSFALNV